MLVNSVKHVSIRKLFHEFIVDVWVVIKQVQLHWVGMNLMTLRADIYQGLIDTIGNVVNEEIEFQNFGHRLTLPSSFVGNYYNMFEIFQDSWPSLAISSTLIYLEL
jgi:hypothetical protein